MAKYLNMQQIFAPKVIIIRCKVQDLLRFENLGVTFLRYQPFILQTSFQINSKSWDLQPDSLQILLDLVTKSADHSSLYFLRMRGSFRQVLYSDTILFPYLYIILFSISVCNLLQDWKSWRIFNEF